MCLARRTSQAVVPHRPTKVFDVQIEDVAPVDAIELAFAALHAARDLAGTETARHERGQDGAGADPAVNIHVAERNVGQKIGKRAQRAELVEQPFDAAPRQTEGHFAVTLTRQGLPDTVHDFAEDGIALGPRDGAEDAQATGLERETRPALVGVDDKPNLLATDGSADVVVAEELVQKTKSRTLLDGPTFAPRIDDERVGGPGAKLGQKARRTRLDMELEPESLRHDPAGQGFQRRVCGTNGMRSRRARGSRKPGSCRIQVAFHVIPQATVPSQCS